MTYFNNAIFTKRDLLVRVLTHLKNNTLWENIDRIPLEMRPRTTTPIRCCVHKDRAVLKYKLMGLLGYSVTDEEDELTSLSQYAVMALSNKKESGEFLTVVDEACSSCVQVNYMVSNLCKGCEARACQFNCSKDAITMFNGQAIIDHQKCVNCGMCQKACPYHAIIYIPVPCEESCPVRAIKKNDDGIETIDFSKCIHCGKCINACPFGAVVEKSQVLQVHKALTSKKEVIALVAPSLLGQFNAEPEQIFNAIKAIGFSRVVEVAQGADITTRNEALELKERVAEGAPFMTTSCCPAYTQLVEKHIPKLAPFVSHTPSPLGNIAKVMRDENPDAVLVFVGPCVAKRKEAFETQSVNYVMTFEEMGAFFTAHNIIFEAPQASMIQADVTPQGWGFAMAGGVTAAVQATLEPGETLKTFLVDGLTTKKINLLKTFSQRPPAAQFVEVMSCEGGCVNGPGTVLPKQTGSAQFRDNMKKLYPDFVIPEKKE